LGKVTGTAVVDVVEVVLVDGGEVVEVVVDELVVVAGVVVVVAAVVATAASVAADAAFESLPHDANANRAAHAAIVIQV